MSNAPDDDRAASYMSDDSDDLSYRLRSLYAERGPLIVAVGAIIGSLALLCLFALLLTRAGGTEEATPTPMPDEVEREVDTDTFDYEAISDAGAITVTMETPIFIDVAGEQFSVQAEVIPEEGAWTPAVPNETTSLWVYGSVINYIFGLDDTNENRQLLENVVMGDEIVLRTRSGATSTFAVSSRQQVESDNRAIFAQNAPAITLLLIEEDLAEQRLMVTGRYVVSDAKSETQAGRVVEMGETAQLESLQITVTGFSTQFDRPEAPAGFAFLQIDYQVQNVGVSSVEANSLNLVLADDLGNLYAVNPVASGLGNNPPLGGTIAAGQTVVATAGYQIPAELTSATLHWQVSIVGTGAQIQVNIPYQETAAPVPQAAVSVQEATITADGGSLLIVGQINNLGDQPLSVDFEDVSLTGGGTVYLMLSTNPAFPWVVGPGQTLLYGVTFQRPFGSEAVFTVLNQSFQLTGLQ